MGHDSEMSGRGSGHKDRAEDTKENEYKEEEEERKRGWSSFQFHFFIIFRTYIFYWRESSVLT